MFLKIFEPIENSNFCFTPCLFSFSDSFRGEPKSSKEKRKLNSSSPFCSKIIYIKKKQKQKTISISS